MAFYFPSWKRSVLGHRIDVDKRYGDQCVDVIMHIVQAIWKKAWYSIIGYGNAKDVFYTASSSYFTKIRNNSRDPNQVPKQGDVVCIGPFRGNPYGHVYVADGTNRVGANCIEQNGFNPAGVCYEKFRGYAALPIIGWLRPKTSIVNKVVQKVKPKAPSKPSIYVVRPGDTVYGICKKFGLSITRFKQLNPQVSNINRIYVGQHLRVK